MVPQTIRLDRSALQIIEEYELEHPGSKANPLRLIVEIYMDPTSPTDMRLDAAKAMARYIAPQKAPVQDSPEAQKPLRAFTIIEAIRANPEAAKLAEDLSFALAATAPELMLPEASSLVVDVESELVPVPDPDLAPDKKE